MDAWQIIAAVSAVIGSVVGLVSIIAIGLQQVSHLAKIDANSENMLEAIRQLKTEVHELKSEMMDDSEKQWQKISEHDVELAKIKTQLS